MSAYPHWTQIDANRWQTEEGLDGEPDFEVVRMKVLPAEMKSLQRQNWVNRWTLATRFSDAPIRKGTFPSFAEAARWLASIFPPQPQPRLPICKGVLAPCGNPAPEGEELCSACADEL